MSAIVVRGSCDAGRCQDLVTSLSSGTTKRSMRIEQPVELGRDPIDDIHFVWLLRGCASFGVGVQWAAETMPPWDLRLAYHLPPPASLGKPDEPSVLNVWRQSFVYGSCFYRKGPGFYLIKDTRDQSRMRRLRISVDGATDGFDQLLQPAATGDLTAEAKEVVEALLPLGLVLAVGDHVVSLPFRMRHWPVPADRA